jgi:adenylate kinase
MTKRARDEGRSDDTEEVIRHRQDVYTEQTAPLIEVYDDRGLLVRVDGMGAVDEVTSRVFDALDETSGANAG